MIPFPDKKYSIIYADPPWSYSDSGCSGAAAAQYATMSINELKQLPVNPAGGGVLCFTRWDVQQVFIDALRLAGLTVKSVIVWDKKAHGMGDLKGSFAPRYEAIIFATKGRYELPGKRPDDLIACAKVGNQSLTHPNEKPVALLEQLIEATTIPGALILDPFAGSGSTLAAAAKTGRQYIGIEIDEQYSKLAATRAAEHHQKGETT